MTVRKVRATDIKNTVQDLCVKANTVLRADILHALKVSSRKERSGTLAKKMLRVLIENAGIAKNEKIALCQDTGMVAVFVELGRNVIISGGTLNDAVDDGVRTAYKKNYFRKSVVKDPVMRRNTGTNTPAIIHIKIVDGSNIVIYVMPKGFGSENKSRIAMLNPTCGPEEIIDFCVETVKIAGPDACPPYILGVGMGGTMESCALLAKKALLRPVNKPNSKRYIANMERLIKDKANKLNIGVMGLGGRTTVMGVNIEEAPTHIAGLPVAVNISCHALRSAKAKI